MSQALSVLPSVVSSLVFLSQMGVGKGSQEKTGVTFGGTSLSLPGTELLNLVPLICSLWGFDRFCLKDKCPAAPKKSSSQTFQNLWCLLVLLQWCSKWRKIPLHSEKSLLKLCAIYRSSQVDYSHDSVPQNCDLAFVFSLTWCWVSLPILTLQSSCVSLVLVII